MTEPQLSIEELLTETKIYEIIPVNREIITLESTYTVHRALQILSGKRILSAPVRDANSMKILGLVDMFDLIAFLLSVFQEKVDVGGRNSGNWSRWWTEFENKTINEVIDLSKLNPFCTVNKDHTLSQLIFIFKEGLHRTVVVDESGSIVNIITQSDILNFLSRYINHYGRKLARTSIRDLSFGKDEVVSVHTSCTAFNAFYKMLKSAVSGVAIIDDEGLLVANISVSDLRGFSGAISSDLFLPVLGYLKKNVPTFKTRFPPATVTLEDTFETLVMKLAVMRLHRLWIEDQQGKPIGVISLTDVLKLLDLKVTATTSGSQSFF